MPTGVQKRRASSLKSNTQAPRRRINDFQLAIENTSVKQDLSPDMHPCTLRPSAWVPQPGLSTIFGAENAFLLPGWLRSRFDGRRRETGVQNRRRPHRCIRTN